ncbi:MAG TPA: PP2C family protein-serine/threonine phosphatase, partial [Thermoanaerobaculia bacterium]|nr:PP2C family protein-serine/threonine phosphatase [Thermoanaerobaculia bacterium]
GSGEIERLNSTGVPVGMFPGASWREMSVTLARGDLLCVYTDGLTEAVNADEEEFGLDRLSTFVGKGRAFPLKDLCDRVLAEVADFAADMPQYDDQTLLLARRTENTGR